MIDGELKQAELEWLNALLWAEAYGRWVGCSTTTKSVPQPIWDELNRTGKQWNDVRQRKQWEYL